MYQTLLKAIKKPELYKKTDVKFWDDEHISAQMLSAHLNPDWDAASRKHSFIKASAEWIKSTLPPESYCRLLDIGCGPGLYDTLFAQMGYRVTGVDFSSRSIAYAKEAAARDGLSIHYLCQDYLSLSLDESFDLCTFIYCDYGALSTEDRRLVLSNVFRCLRPGGRLLFDVFSFNILKDFQEKETFSYYQNGGFFRAEPHLMLEGSYRYGDNVNLSLNVVVTENEVTPYYIWDTDFTKEELYKEVTEAGFIVTGLYGDVSGAKYTEDGDTMAIVVEKPLSSL